MEYKMKDSGIPWIGEIPEHWEIQKGKHLFKKEDRPVIGTEEIVTCFRDGSVTLRSNRRVEGFTNAIKEVGYQGVKKGDLVIHNMDAFAGAIGVSDSNGKSTPVYSVCTPKFLEQVNVFYYAFLLRCYAITGLITSLAKGIRERSTDFRFKDFGELLYQQPPISEQQTIANYLDTKCDEIDNLILLQEKMIADLQAYKQAVITESVTKGLDKNVKMKDSGIEWIGEIPEHWIYKRFKYAGKFVKGNLPQSTNIENLGSPIIGASEMLGKECRLFTDDISLPTCNLDDVIILWDGANAGIVASNLKGIISSTVVKYSCDDPCVHKRYLFYLMKSYERYFKTKVCGTTIPHMNISFINDVPLLVPIYFEQQQIAEYLDKKCDDIDKLILLKKQKIEELKECKKSVIFEYVTGKKQVKNLSGRR